MALWWTPNLRRGTEDGRPAVEHSGLCTGQLSQAAAQALEKAAAAAFPSEHPSRHFPLFGPVLVLTLPFLIPSDWARSSPQESLEDGGLWPFLLI